MITMKNGLKYEELRVGTGEEIQSDDMYKVIIPKVNEVKYQNIISKFSFSDKNSTKITYDLNSQ